MLGAGLVTALLYMPRTKATVAEKPESDIEIQIDKATKLVEGGENPMEGIRIFKEILEKDPDNIEVHYRMGMFSLQSGQFDKAVMRFEKVVGMKNSTYPDAIFFLGKAYQGLGENGKAIDAYTQYKQTTTDTVVLNGVENLIKELSN